MSRLRAGQQVRVDWPGDRDHRRPGKIIRTVGGYVVRYSDLTSNPAPARRIPADHLVLVKAGGSR